MMAYESRSPAEPSMLPHLHADPPPVLQHWPDYKAARARELEDLGYAVRGQRFPDKWLYVGAIGSPGASRYLSAEVRFLRTPVDGGLLGGRILELRMFRVERPTCRDLFERRGPLRMLMARYDRSTQRILKPGSQPAARLYRDIVQVLN